MTHPSPSLYVFLQNILPPLLLIIFCVQIFAPQLGLADDPLSGSGSIITPSYSSHSSLSSYSSYSSLSSYSSHSSLSSYSSHSSLSSYSSYSSLSSYSSFSLSPEAALSPLRVVITEVMWMGSDVSTADEWVEIGALPNPGSFSASARSLSGWTLRSMKDSGEAVIARFPAGFTIGSGAFLVISNYGKDASRLAAQPALISTSMSLPNTKLLLRLRDASGSLIDEVDDYIGNPFAGANPSGGGAKASMERIDFFGLGNVAASWRTATESKGFDPGTAIFGTPGFAPTLATAVQQSSSSNSSYSSNSSPSSPSSYSSPSSNSSPSSPQSSSQQILVFSGSSLSSSPSLASSRPSTSSIASISSFSLRINELLPNPKGSDDNEWIEVVNRGTVSASLSGMTIRVGTVPHRIKSLTSFFVEPGAYAIIPKSAAGFTLTNNGATVRLESGASLIDSFSYSSVPEGVSAGRNDLGEVVPFCMPSPGRENLSVGLDASLDLQSGTPVGIAPVTLNLGISTKSGSLASAVCTIDYGDGYTSQSCNPSSHTIRVVGPYTITATLHDYCGNTVIQTLNGNVTPKPFSQHVLSTKAPQTSLINCTPSAFSGVELSEIFPNPTGEEKDREWIELHNTTGASQPLCGWSLDDGNGGSRPYRLSQYQLPPDAYLLLLRSQTAITLNNDHDMVRLIAPLPQGGTGVSMSIFFDNAPDDQSYTRTDSGEWQWNSVLTPGEKNRFEEAKALYEPSPLSLVAAYPNPLGEDQYDDEWIEIQNRAGWPIWLNGWSIRDAKGKKLDLTGTVLSKVETKRIPLYRKSYTLANAEDTLYLVDQAGVVHSVLSWNDAKEGATQRPFITGKKRDEALVRQVIDATTILVQKDNDPAEKLTTVTLLGIRFPESIQDYSNTKELVSDLIINKKVELEFDTDSEIKGEIEKAYVFLDGRDIQQEMLTKGWVYASRFVHHGRLNEYIAYENLAKSAYQGIWSKPQLAEDIEQTISQEELWTTAKDKGLKVAVSLSDGLVPSGSLVHVWSQTGSRLYLSTNNSPFQAFSGSFILSKDTTVRAYAEVAVAQNTETVRSDILEKTYILEDATLDRGVRVSEVYPSPKKGESEWIELHNPTDHTISISGWLVDDGSGGSLPYRLEAGLTLEPDAYYLVGKDRSKITLNNDGDRARLLTPGGELVDEIPYGKVKTGYAVAIDPTNGDVCTTQKPTPAEMNTCFVLNKKITQKKGSNKGLKSNNSNKKVKRKEPTKAEIYARNHSGAYATLQVQLNSSKSASNPDGSLGFKDGILLTLLLNLILLISWFLKKKYSSFS